MTNPNNKLEKEIKKLKNKCELYESWLRAIDEYADFDVWFKDNNSRYQFVNRKFEAVIDRNRDQLNGASPEDIFGPERAQRIVALDQKIMKEGHLKRLVPCDETGDLQMHEELRFPVRDKDGNIVGLGCFAFEVTEQSMAEEALDRAQTLAKLGNWRWSIKNKCLISCSKEFSRLLGCSTEDTFELMENRLTRIVHPEDRHILKPIIDHMGKEDFGTYQIEYRIVRPDGEIRHVLEMGEPLIGNNGKPVEYAGTLQDVTYQKKIQEELRESKETRIRERAEHLEYLASYDVLTGLLNRNALYEKTSSQIRKNELDPETAAIILVDLDGFKDINDCFGHKIGDEILKIVAKRLLQSVGHRGFIARLDGDEFAIILFGLDAPYYDALTFCKRIDREISSKIVIDLLEFYIGCHFGISMITDGGDDLSEAVKCADIALYKAKQSQDHKTVVFEKKMAEEIALRKRLEADLRTAILNEEIHVAYQPQVSLHDDSLTGFEALARWNHPEFGNIIPTVFVSIAEDCGLINDLGNYILEKSCYEISNLNKATGQPIRLAANISTSQFYNHSLIASICNVIDKKDLSPELLEVEITESLFIKNLDHTRHVLDQLRDMGIKIALDDFGTGYSALSYLKQFNVDRIKLDRTFIKDVVSCEADQRIVEGIIGLAKSLNLQVIGEGVETEKQRDYLKSIGCDEAQGYYYGRPMSYDQVLTFLLHDTHDSLQDKVPPPPLKFSQAV